MNTKDTAQFRPTAAALLLLAGSRPARAANALATASPDAGLDRYATRFATFPSCNSAALC